MKRRQFIQTGSFGLSVLLTQCSGIFQPKKRPNILLITADDLGTEIGCYEDPFARTPRLDLLAKEGVRFSRAFVTTASCSPSRSSMLTGLYPHQNGQIGLAHVGYHMNEGITTLPNVLKANGYHTGIVGKLHVEPEKEIGFEYDLGDDDRDNMVFKHRNIAGTRDQIETFIKQAEETNRPFFMMANYFDPHRKFKNVVNGIPEKVYTADQVKPLPFYGPVDSRELREEAAMYYNCISRLDTGVGMLIDLLKKHQLEKNTMVMFLGDHGGPFTRAKTTCYEAGLRIPFIVWWPGKVRENLVRDEMISTVDIMPTILDAAGIHPVESLPGQSFLPIVKGKTVSWRKTLCAEYHTHIARHYFPRRSIRNDRYKLILNLLDGKNPVKGVDGCVAYDEAQKPRYDNTVIRKIYDTYSHPGRVELYDLQEDPYEFYNLAGQKAYHEIQNQLMNQLETWRIETRDPLLDPEYFAELTEEHMQYRKNHIKDREGSQYVKEVVGELTK